MGIPVGSGGCGCIPNYFLQVLWIRITLSKKWGKNFFLFPFPFAAKDFHAWKKKLHIKQFLPFKWSWECKYLGIDWLCSSAGIWEQRECCGFLGIIQAGAAEGGVSPTLGLIWRGGMSRECAGGGIALPGSCFIPKFLSGHGFMGILFQQRGESLGRNSSSLGSWMVWDGS